MSIYNREVNVLTRKPQCPADLGPPWPVTYPGKATQDPTPATLVSSGSHYKMEEDFSIFAGTVKWYKCLQMKEILTYLLLRSIIMVIELPILITKINCPFFKKKTLLKYNEYTLGCVRLRCMRVDLIHLYSAVFPK